MSIIGEALPYWWAAVLCAIGLFLWDKRARFHPTLPAPGAVFYLGMIPTYMKRWGDIHDWWYETSVAQGWKTYQQAIPSSVACHNLIITDPKVVKHILKDNFDNYIKGPNFQELFFDLLGRGIFNINGDAWREQRKIASHMFSLTRLREDMSTVFTRNSEILIQLIDTWCRNKQSFDIQDLFFRSTLDSFTEIAYGEGVGALSMKPTPFATAFDTAQRITNERQNRPTWTLQRWLGIGTERDMAKQITIINEYAYDMIRKRRRAPDCNTRHDLLSLFFQTKEENGSELTDVYLRDVILNFMIAGRDTTACLLSWCIYEITQHPEVEEKLMKELREAYEYKQPSYDAATLPYLQAFIYETLRLHPSVPLDGKNAVNADTLPDGTKIEAGTGCWFAIYAMGRHPGIWGSDCLEFRPERWIERDSYPTPYEFPHFFAGPRLCLGKSVAIMQASLVLSTILLKYRISLVPGQRVTYQPTVTLPILNGLHVTATPR